MVPGISSCATQLFIFVSWHERHFFRSEFFRLEKFSFVEKEVCNGSVHLMETEPSLCQGHCVIL